MSNVITRENDFLRKEITRLRGEYCSTSGDVVRQVGQYLSSGGSVLFVYEQVNNCWTMYAGSCIISGYTVCFITDLLNGVSSYLEMAPMVEHITETKREVRLCIPDGWTRFC